MRSVHSTGYTHVVRDTEPCCRPLLTAPYRSTVWCTACVGFALGLLSLSAEVVFDCVSGEPGVPTGIQLSLVAQLSCRCAVAVVCYAIAQRGTGFALNSHLLEDSLLCQQQFERPCQCVDGSVVGHLLELFNAACAAGVAASGALCS